MKNNKEQLISYLNKYSVHIGKEFELSSGKKSNIYIDTKKLALHNQFYKFLAELLYNKMAYEFINVEVVAGVVLGGCHLASIVAMQSLKPLDIIYVRKEAKTHGTKNLIERPDTTNENVVLIEDVLTTGQSAINAAKILDDEKFNVLGVLSVVDRRENKTSKLDKWKVVSLVNMEELNGS